MEMTMRLPANYNVMSEEEMVYTQGGADVTAILKEAGRVLVTGVVVLNWLDLLSGARKWISENKTGDIVVDTQNSVQAWVDYTTSSLWNGIRSVGATLTAITGSVSIGGTWVPYGLLGTALAFLTA